MLADRGGSSPDTWQLLSLLYRLDGLYDEEKRMIDRVVSNFPEWQYGHERRNWHALPMFEKCVPRPPLHLDHDPDFTPDSKTIEQLCIVLTSDSRYFTLLVECIESIQATRLYKDVPICIVEGGLTEDELQTLSTRYGIASIENIDRHLDVMCVADAALDPFVQLLLSRCFADKIFPGYGYYLYIDVDAWVHDERGLDRFVRQAQQQGVAATAPGNLFSSSAWPERKILCDEDTNRILGFPFVAASAYCMDATGNWFNDWQAIIRKIISRGISLQYGTDEATLNFVCHAGGITDFLTMTQLHSLWWFIPVVSRTNPHHLFDAYESIGLFHMTSAFMRDQCHYLPTQFLEDAWEDPLGHGRTSRQILTELRAGSLEKAKYFEHQTTISTHYRVWPWQEGEHLKMQIKQVVRRLGT
jgi:hypothetical protein